MGLYAFIKLAMLAALMWAAYRTGWEARGERDAKRRKAAQDADFQLGLSLATMPQEAAEKLFLEAIAKRADSPEALREVNDELKRRNETSTRKLALLAPRLPEGSGFRRQVEELVEERKSAERL